MCSDNCARIERLDFVECGDPLPSLLGIRLGEIEVNVIVGGITGNHESDRRDIQTGRMIRVGMTELHSDQFVPFQIYYIPFELLRDHQLVRNLPWKSRLPDRTEELRGGILAHNLHRIGRCHRSGVWEPLENSADSKPMVSMAMRNVD